MPPGPGAVRPRLAARGPRGRAPPQRRPHPRGDVRLQRSGLYCTMVNTHLAAEEAAYIVGGLRRTHPDHLVDAGAAGRGHDLVTHTAVGTGSWWATVRRRATTSYDEFVADAPANRSADEVEGSAMLYSSGTTGHPKGIRRPLSGALRLGRGSGSDARRDHGIRGGTSTSARRRSTTRPRWSGP